MNNTVKEQRQLVGTIIWRKNNSGLSQNVEDSEFEVFSYELEAQWLAEQGFQYTFDTVTGKYRAFEMYEDEVGNVFFDIVMSTAIAAIKVDEKNLLAAFTYDENVSVGEPQYVFHPAFTRTFEDVLEEKVPLTFFEAANDSIQCEWNSQPLFNFVKNGPRSYDFDITLINDPLVIKFRELGLRNEVIIEPFNILTINELGNQVYVKGFALYSYGVYHYSALGFFEYETGKLNFKTELVGNYNSTTNNIVDTAKTHIRHYFDNYGILEKDVKMDTITLIPDNEIEEMDGFEVITGSQTDFDPIYTQTIRAKINDVEISRI